MKFYVGSDISEGKINFCIYDGKTFVCDKEVANSTEELLECTRAILSFCESLAKDEPYEILMAMEYTGIYNNLLLDVVDELKIKTTLIHASNIKTAFGQDRLKNDKIDARKIAEYAMRFHDKLQIWKPVSDNIKAIRHLSTERNFLVKMKAQFEQRAKGQVKFFPSSTNKTIKGNMDPVVDSIDAAIKKFEKEIHSLIMKDAEIKQNYTLLVSVPGIGPVTARALIAYTDNFTKFNNSKKLGCYSGIVPFEQSSGIYKGRSKVSHKANKNLKTLLHMCAVSTSQTNSQFGQYYRRKILEGKNKMSVLNALRNKILKTGFACVINKTPYQADYQYDSIPHCG